MTTPEKIHQGTFPEPKTRSDWKVLIKAMKNAQAEDYPHLNPVEFMEFKAALSRVTSGRTQFFWVAIGGLFLLGLIIAQFGFGVQLGAIIWLLSVVVNFVFLYIGGQAAQDEQSDLLALGWKIGLFRDPAT